MPANSLQTRMITDLAELRKLSPEWSYLWNRFPGATTFQRPEWVLAWTEAVNPQKLRVVEVRRAGILMGLAPLFLYNSGSERILAPLAASVSDYLDWLVDPISATEILDAIFENLNKQSWDRLDLTDLPHTSSLLKFEFRGWNCEQRVETACPVLALPSNASCVEEVLPGKQRHNLRTARHRMEKAGNAQIEVAGPETLGEFLEAMLRLHSSRWAQCGNSGMLADAAIQRFHRLAAPALLEAGILRLYGLRFCGELIATLYALSEGETVYCYLQGFDPKYSAFSPGVQILAAVIDDAIREEKKTVDFLRGREAYKYLWGARDEETYRLCVRRSAQAEQPVHPAMAA